VNKVVDHETTTEQNRDTNQHGNKERHERSPSVIRAGGSTWQPSGRSGIYVGFRKEHMTANARGGRGLPYENGWYFS
jgi:hypothetical protein